jgi:MoaA/NifB/PqqE/SkfB family radical SAM enzyme
MSITCPYITKGLRLEFSTSVYKELLYRTRPCCHMHGDKFDNDLKQWNVCNTWQDLETHNNRKHFINWENNKGTFHNACWPCSNIEQHTPQRSPRFIYKDNIEVDYHILDVVIGSTCNLACPFCAPNVSSLIEKISKKYTKKELPGKWKNEPTINGNPISVAKVVSEFISNRRVGELKIIGGEPLLVENWNEISKVINSDLCNNMSLTFTTNGTIMNKKIISNLYKVKSSKITVSVDSIENNYNFIRWPYNWNKVKDNINYLLEHKPTSAFVNIDGLVNIFNFELLPIIEQEFNKWPSYSFMFDLKPEGSPMDFKVLPKEILKDVYNKLQNKHMKSSIEYAIDNYEILNYQDKYNEAVRTCKWFLKQRNMTKDVFGIKTIKYLGL